MNDQYKKTKPADSDELELKAINKKRSLIVVTSFLAILVFAMALLQAPPSAVVIVAIIILISLKKAAINYSALGKKKSEIIGH